MQFFMEGVVSISAMKGEKNLLVAVEAIKKKKKI